MTALLQAENVAVYSGDMPLTQPVSLALRPGVPFTLIGETGSGKSLLAQALSGALPDGLAARGTLHVDQQTIALDNGPGALRPLWGKTLAILPQEPWLALDPTMKIGPQVAESFRYVRGFTAGQTAEATRDSLQQLELAHAEKQYPSQISGGMAQRAAFAAARAGGARIMVADEPTKGLDTARRDEVSRLLMESVRDGGGLLTITHDIELARQLGGEVAVMRDGEIIERGTAAEVLDAPQHPFTRQLLAADPQRWPDAAPSSDAASPVIVATDISKSRGGRQLFDGLSLTIASGEIVGLQGPSGCGKSTFGDLLLGLVKADSGTVRRTDGADPLRFQKIYQDPPGAFAPEATLGKLLRDLVNRHRLDPAEIPPLMQRLGLADELLERKPDSVSGGELQRFSLLRVLLLKPVFIFADEPTSRLDPLTQQQTIALLCEVARERGCAVLLVSHDRTLLDKVSQRVISLEG